MTAENAKSLKKVVYMHTTSNHITSCLIRSYHYRIRLLTTVVAILVLITIPTDRYIYTSSRPICSPYMYNLYLSLTHHTSSTPQHTPYTYTYTGHSTSFWVGSWRYIKSSAVSCSKVTLNPLTVIMMTMDYCTQDGSKEDLDPQECGDSNSWWRYKE